MLQEFIDGFKSALPDAHTLGGMAAVMVVFFGFVATLVAIVVVLFKVFP